MKVAVGFSIFLERIIPYAGIKEKASMTAPPKVQLGGGAYNVVKTLLSLGISSRDLSLLGVVGMKRDIDRSAVEKLIGSERFFVTLLPIRARTSSSYYLVPLKGDTWGIGDGGGPFRTQATRVRHKIVQSKGRAAELKIAMEVSSDSNGILLAQKFLEKTTSRQISALVPTDALLRSGGMGPLLKVIDFLALNEEEGKIFWKKTPARNDLIKAVTPMILLTRGTKGAWLKINDRIYDAKPMYILKSPSYVGGAGDATVAALLYSLFIKKSAPAAALRFAVEIGRKTLLLPSSYYIA